MGFLRLVTRNILLAALAISAAGAISPAAAEPVAPRATLALSSEPSAPSPALLDDPAQTPPTEKAAAPASGHAPWWLWAVIAAAAAGVGALVVTSASKDPTCPHGRTCQ